VDWIGALGALLCGLRGCVALGEQRRREVDAGEIRSGQIRLPQNSYAHVRAGKPGALYVRRSQIYIPQKGALKIRVRKIAAKKFHAAGLRFRQIGAGKNRFRHVRVSKVCLHEPCAGKVGAGQFGFAKVRAFEVGVAENGSGEVGSGQVGVRKVGAGQVGANAAIFAAEKALVRFENISERLAVVLDAFWFSESHGPSAIDGIGLLVYSMWLARGTARRQPCTGIGGGACAGAACARSELTTAWVTSLPPHELL